jgi:hypothetical protein
MVLIQAFSRVGREQGAHLGDGDGVKRSEVLGLGEALAESGGR